MCKSPPDGDISRKVSAFPAGQPFEDKNDNAVRLGLSVPLPVFDQNAGNIIAAEEALAKTGAERAINKLVLISVAGRAYDAVNGALAELKLLRTSRHSERAQRVRNDPERLSAGPLHAARTARRPRLGSAGAAPRAGSPAEFPHRRRDDRRSRRQSVFARAREFAMIQRIDAIFGLHSGCRGAGLRRIPDADAGDDQDRPQPKRPKRKSIRKCRR